MKIYALNWIMHELLGLLKNNDLALRARSLFLRRPRSSCIILYIENVLLQNLDKMLDMSVSEVNEAFNYPSEAGELIQACIRQ
jgi:hypothetical protein